MSWSNTKGFNFRETSGFVTDGTNETYDINDSYPSARTIDGDTFNIGWTYGSGGGGSEVRDRNAAIDRRCAGISFVAAASNTDQWIIELPAPGQYDIGLAMGDDSNGFSLQWKVVDVGVGILESVSGISTSAGQFADATGVVRTSASDWASNNVKKRYTFSGTTCGIILGDAAVGSATSALGGPMAHFDIVAAGPADNPNAGIRRRAQSNHTNLSF